MPAHPSEPSAPPSSRGGQDPATGGDPSRSRPSGWALVGAFVLALIVVVAAIGIPVAIMRNRDDRRTESQDRSGRATTFDPPLTDAERELLPHIPFVVAMDASRVVWARSVRCARSTLAQRAVASFACDLSGAGADRVVYTAYDSTASMARVYERLRTTAGVDRYEGLCRNGPPAEGNWQVTVGGAAESVVSDGRVLCLRREGVGVIVWTYDGPAILSEASSTGGWAALHRFWSTDAGPLG